jgi:hypothetical protein
MKDREQTIYAAKMSGNIYGKKSGSSMTSHATNSPRYGSRSVMEEYRKPEMSSEEREFRKLGGIEMLANKARGISSESTDDPLTFKGNQAAALEYKKTFNENKEEVTDTTRRQFFKRAGQVKKVTDKVKGRKIYGGGGGKMPLSGMESAKDPTGMSLLRKYTL